MYKKVAGVALSLVFMPVIANAGLIPQVNEGLDVQAEVVTPSLERRYPADQVDSVVYPAQLITKGQKELHDSHFLPSAGGTPVEGVIEEKSENSDVEEEYDFDEYAEDLPEIEVTEADVEDVNAKIDPLETVNRAIYNFNDTVDGLLLRPLAQGYRDIVPQWGRDRIGGVLENLRSPVYVLNSLLQGEGEKAAAGFWRFFVNTTIGLGGMYDSATELGMPKIEEDFGQTLAEHGVGTGPYLMLPLLGPTTARDATGLVFDSVTNPFNYAASGLVVGKTVTETVHRREGLIDTLDNVKEDSFDPYATIRSGYLQRRSSQVEHGSDGK